jgi:hypothetical protein
MYRTYSLYSYVLVLAPSITSTLLLVHIVNPMMLYLFNACRPISALPPGIEPGVPGEAAGRAGLCAGPLGRNHRSEHGKSQIFEGSVG